MSRKKFLFLALDSAAWGRTALGVAIADELRGQGDDSVFVVHSASSPVVAAGRFRFEELPPHMDALSQLYIEQCLETEQPQGVVLCDFHGCMNYFEQRDIDPMFLWRHDAPILALDIWNSAETDCDVDLFGERHKPRARHIDRTAGRLVPAPFGRPTAEAAYRALPADTPVSNAARRDARERLGVGPEERLVLFCTSDWQHRIHNPRGARLLRALPTLLWRYLKRAAPTTRLLHVGPARLDLPEAGDRYWYHAAVADASFSTMLHAADLVLSANISATTNGRAIAAGVPVVVVQNSCDAETVDELDTWLAAGSSGDVRTWAEETLPLYPFSLWPLGYRRFLEPLFRDNPYCDAVHVIEMLDDRRFVETCHRLLHEPAAQDDTRARMAAYAARVSTLPSAVDLLNTYV